MAETIRDYVKRRMKLCYVAIAGSVAGFAALLRLNGGKPSRLEGLVLFAGFIVGSMTAARIDCPRCSTPFGNAGVNIAFRLFGKRTDSCPSCGVNLDEPVKRERG